MKTKIFKIIRIIAILVCLGIIAYESYKIYDDQKEYQVAKNEYEELENIAVSYPLVEDEAAITDYPLLQIDFDRLKSINDDVVAWIYFPALDISYPVVHENEIDEYLYVTFDGTSNKSGSIFEDVLSDPEFRGMHDIVFGHNMKNGTMFGSLDKYRDQSYEKNHSIIKFSSLYEDREYEICAVFLSQVYKKSETDVFKYYQFFNADTEEEFDDFYSNIKKMSMYDTGVDAEYGDEFITLSVCAYHVDNGRLVVVGKRINLLHSLKLDNFAP